MPITNTATTYTMTDAEFQLMNEGQAAPTINPQGQFAGFISLNGSAPITATSATGTTTVTLTAGNRSDGNIRLLAQRLRRGSDTLNIAWTN